MIMKTVADQYKPSRVNLDKGSFKAEQWKAFTFILSHMGRIEIDVAGVLQRVYFPILPICH